MNKQLQESWQNKKERVSDVLSRAVEQKSLPDVLEDLFTPQEIETLNERILLLQSLIDGQTQRDVATKLGISVTTVNRGARTLKYGTGKIRSVL